MAEVESVPVGETATLAISFSPASGRIESHIMLHMHDAERPILSSVRDHRDLAEAERFVYAALHAWIGAGGLGMLALDETSP